MHSISEVRTSAIRKVVYIILVLLLLAAFALGILGLTFMSAYLSRSSNAGPPQNMGVTASPTSTSTAQNSFNTNQTPLGVTMTPSNTSNITPTTAMLAQKIYEAEAQGNTIVSPAYIEKCPKCSGGHMVASVGYNAITNPASQGSLQFNNVYVPQSGTYAIAISYCLSATVVGNILVNNSVVVNVTYTSADNECWQNDAAGPKEVTINIALLRGENTLKFTTPESPGTMGTIPSIDCIKIDY